MTYRILFLMVAIVLCPTAIADIIPSKKYYVRRCAIITNLNQYPEVVLVSGICKFKDQYYVVKVNEGSCIEGQPRRGQFNLFATSATHFKAINPDNHNAWRDSLMLASDIEIDAAGFYESNEVPLIEHHDYYRIVGFTNGNVVMHKWKTTYKFNGAADSVVLFNNNNDTINVLKNFPLR